MNRRVFTRSVALAATSLPFGLTVDASPKESESRKNSQIRVAVLTGGHNFDVPGFQKLFRSLNGVDAYIQHLDDFACASDAVRDSYDVILFYLMFRETPVDENQPWYRGKPRRVLDQVLAGTQGIVVLHHALVAYLDWPAWSRLVGITDRASNHSWHPDQKFRVRIAPAKHPITRDCKDFDLTDETYKLNPPEAGCETVLSTDHPQSMGTLAWTRQPDKARVFCFQSGHGNSAWNNPGFQKILQRGIEWSCRHD